MKLPNADTDSVISLQFQFTLQKNSTFILSKADIRNPLRYLLESVKIQDRFLLL